MKLKYILIGIVASIGALDVAKADALDETHVLLNCSFSPSAVVPAVDSSVVKLSTNPDKWRYTYTVTATATDSTGPLDRFALLTDVMPSSPLNGNWMADRFDYSGLSWLQWIRQDLMEDYQTGTPTTATFVLDSNEQPGPILWAASTVPRSLQPARTLELVSKEFGEDEGSEFIQEELSGLCDSDSDFLRNPRVGVVVGPSASIPLKMKLLNRSVKSGDKQFEVVGLEITTPLHAAMLSPGDLNIWVGSHPVVITDTLDVANGIQVLGLPHEDIGCGQAAVSVRLKSGKDVYTAAVPFPDKPCAPIAQQVISLIPGEK